MFMLIGLLSHLISDCFSKTKNKLLKLLPTVHFFVILLVKRKRLTEIQFLHSMPLFAQVFVLYSIFLSPNNSMTMITVVHQAHTGSNQEKMLSKQALGTVLILRNHIRGGGVQAHLMTMIMPSGTFLHK